MNTVLKKYVHEFDQGRELNGSDAEAVLDALITESDERPIADLLTAWKRKGIESNEIYLIARILRERMIRVNTKHETFVDIVGTGGSKAKTFNVSTASHSLSRGQAFRSQNTATRRRLVIQEVPMFYRSWAWMPPRRPQHPNAT